MKRIPSLDGLRAIAILLVLLGHLAGTRYFLSAATVASAGDVGNLGVRLLRPLVSMGVLSYSLYLWQQLFLIQSRPVTSMFVVFPLNIVMAFACAAVSYHLVEKPFLRLKHRFEPGHARVARPPSAVQPVDEETPAALPQRGMPATS